MSIEIASIRKRFGSFVALDNVSLSIPSGQLVALLGPSGSGKTTLLRIIAGLEQPEPGGSLRFHDAEVASTPAGDRQVGFVFQHYALFRHMTVFDNVAFGLEVRPRARRPSKDEIRARVERLLDLVQLRGLAGRNPTQLSGGQRQRVALARALAVEPRILLLDEPFGALDAKVRKELRAWLRRLHEQIHVTTVFVTHDQDEAFEVADRVVVMNRGAIEQEGSPEEVFHHPRTRFVIDFLGDVNRFRGRIAGDTVRFAGDAEAKLGADHGGPYRTLALPEDATEDPNASADVADVFVRPHELDVSVGAVGPGGFAATVQRVHTAGPSARLELTTRTGEDLVAHVSLDQVRVLGLDRGSEVAVTPRHARIFTAGREG